EPRGRPRAAVHRLLRRRRRAAVPPPGRLRQPGAARRRHPPLRAGSRRLMPEVRVDPLTGLRTIVAAERAARPGGGPRCEPAPPLDPERDPFLEGHEDRTPPEVYARRPGGGPANGPGWTVRVVPNLYP